MTKKALFEAFDKDINKKALEAISDSADKLRRRVKKYTESPTVSHTQRLPFLPFRKGVLKAKPGADCDLDKAVSERFRALDRARWKLEKHLPKKNGKKKYRQKVIVAEGDSWFRHPFFYAIADQITQNGQFFMRNNAEWGYTLKEIRENKDKKGNEDAEGYEGEEGYLTVLRREEPEYFLLSAGGNDLQVLLESKKLLNRDGSLTEDGKNALKEIKEGYKELLSEVTKEFPHLKVLTYGYDYPRPRVGEGTYIGQHLKKLCICKNRWDPIMKNVLNELNASIQKAVNDCGSPNVRYLNCRGATKGCKWEDDMHPSSKGFKALAKKFEAKMIQWRKEGQS